MSDGQSWSAGMVVITVLLVLFVIAFITILVTKAKWANTSSNTTTSPPDQGCVGNAPPPASTSPTQEVEADLEGAATRLGLGLPPAIPQAEMKREQEGSVFPTPPPPSYMEVSPSRRVQFSRTNPQQTIRISDPEHPLAAPSIFELGEELEPVAYGYFKPDEFGDPLSVTAACRSSSSGDIYVHLDNPAMAGIYRYNQEEGKWEYLLATGRSKYEARFGRSKGQFDTKTSNVIYGVWVEAGREDKVHLVTLDGVYQLTASSPHLSNLPTKISYSSPGEEVVARSGAYSLTRAGQILQAEGGFPLQLAAELQLGPDDPHQLVDLEEASRGLLRYGYICRLADRLGVALIGQEKSWFVPAEEVAQFGLVDTNLFYVTSNGDYYKRAIGEDQAQLLAAGRFPSGEGAVFLVDGGFFISS